MSQEFETAALGSIGATASAGGSDGAEGGTQECRNCGAPVYRKFCGNCGQLAQNFHKPIGHLVAEVLSDFLSLDGRVARTIPALLFLPGKITRSYLDGKRQRYVPPFRLYLLSSFIFFLVFFSVGQSQHWFDFRFTPSGGDRGAVSDVLEKNDTVVDPLVSPGDDAPPKDDAEGAEEGTHIDPKELIKDDGRVNRDYVDQALDGMIKAPDDERAAIKELVHVAADVYDNPRVFLSAMQNWAPRLALGITPGMILCLILVYPFRQGIFVYDHVITSLHFQTWLYLLTTFVLLLFWGGMAWAWWIFFLAPPVYIYRLMRRVYGAGRFLGLIRTFIILGLLTFFFLVWIAVVFAFSANETTEISRQLTQN